MGNIWVWVKIRYPNNWMVNTKLDISICGPLGLPFWPTSIWKHDVSPVEIFRVLFGYFLDRAIWPTKPLSTRMDEVHCGPVDVTFGETRYVALSDLQCRDFSTRRATYTCRSVYIYTRNSIYRLYVWLWPEKGVRKEDLQMVCDCQFFRHTSISWTTALLHLHTWTWSEGDPSKQPMDPNGTMDNRYLNPQACTLFTSRCVGCLESFVALREHRTPPWRWLSSRFSL